MKELKEYISSNLSEGFYNNIRTADIMTMFYELYREYSRKFVDAGFGMYNLENIGVPCNDIDKSHKIFKKNWVVDVFQIYPDDDDPKRMYIIIYNNKTEDNDWENVENIIKKPNGTMVLLNLYNEIVDSLEQY